MAETRNLQWTIAKKSPSRPRISPSSFSDLSTGDSVSFTVTRDGDGAIQPVLSDNSSLDVSILGNTVTLRVKSGAVSGEVTVTVHVAEGRNYFAYTEDDAVCAVGIHVLVPGKDAAGLELSAARFWLAAASVGNYAIFAGGTPNTYNLYLDTDAFDSSLTARSIGLLEYGRARLAAGSVGDYALFAGGAAYSQNILTTTTAVEAYNASLTKCANPTGLKARRQALAAANAPGYLLFAGGYGSTDFSPKNRGEVDAYSASLAHLGTVTNISARTELAGASVGNYALFAGGNGNIASIVEGYSGKMVKTTLSSGLSTGRWQLAGAGNGTYAVFAGGYSASNSAYNIVDAYDSSLTRYNRTLTLGRRNIAGVQLGAYALFGGGTKAGVEAAANVDSFDANLTLNVLPDLSSARTALAAAAAGKHALFGGGSVGDNTAVKTVDVYMLT